MQIIYMYIYSLSLAFSDNGGHTHTHTHALLQVLRLHLKRFRFSGLTWQKITVGVVFPLELDLQPFYVPCDQEEVDIYHSHDHFLYDLSGVVVHHGLGFSRGHYTAYCWNSQAGERERRR